MPRIGDLILGVVADTAKADRNLKKTRKEMSRTAAAAQATSNAIRGFALAATALVPAALVIGFTKMAESIDDVAKASDRIGIATEQLSALNFAGKIFGATSEDISKALIKQQKSLSEAGVGLMTQKRAFDQLGTSIENLKGLTVENQFLAIGDAIKGVTSQTDQLRIATDIYGRGGAKMLNILKADREEIEKLMGEAKKLGATFSREEAAKVEAFNDAMLRLKTTLGGALVDLTIEIAPAAEKAINMLAGTLREINKFSTETTATRAKKARRRQAVVDFFASPGESVTNGPAFQPPARQQRTGEDVRRDAARRSVLAMQEKTDKAQAQVINRMKELGGKALPTLIDGTGGLIAQFGKGVRDVNEIASKRMVAMEREAEAHAERLQLAGRIAGRFNNQQDDQGNRLNPLLERGSSAAFNALRQNLGGGGTKKTVEEINKQILDEDKKRHDQLNSILDVLRVQVEIPA